MVKTANRLQIPAAGRLLAARYLALAGRGHTAGCGGARGSDGRRGRIRRHGFRRARSHAVHAGAAQGRRDGGEGGAVARGRRRLGGRERGSLVEGSAEFRPFPQRHAVGPDRAGRPHAGPGGLRRLAAIGKGSGCVLHRVQRRDARHAAHAQRRHHGFQHLGAGSGPRLGVDSVLPAAALQTTLTRRAWRRRSSRCFRPGARPIR